jgi:hypothetical protein
MFFLRFPTLKSATIGLLLMAAAYNLPVTPFDTAVMAQAPARGGSGTAPRVPAGSVSGRVTAGGEGVGGIGIELLPIRMNYQRRAVARATTDEQGRYRLTRVPGGRYVIRPLAPTFVLADNLGSGPGKTVVVDEGESVEDINFSMTRGAVITGRITDAEGRPVIAEFVRLDFLDERSQRLNLPYFSSDSRFETDDRGVYRMYGLPPGRYRVSVGNSRDDSMMVTTRGRRAYLRTFYPGVTVESEAKLVEVGAGAEATGIDIKLGPLAEAFKAYGRIVDEESGQPLPGIRYSFGTTNREQTFFGGFGYADRSNQRGEFRIDNLAPGYYSVFVYMDGESEFYSEPTLFEIVDGDVRGLEVRVRRGASMSGVVVAEGPNRRAVLDKLRLQQIYIQVEKQGLQIPMRPLIFAADGSFRVVGLPPGRVMFNVNPYISEGTTTIRIERDGVIQPGGMELTAGEQVTGVRLVVTSGTGSLRGRVVTPSGLVPEGMQLNLVMSFTDPHMAQRQGFVQQSVEVDERGRFFLDGLAAGEYELTLQAFRRPAPGSNRPPQQAARTVTQRVVVVNGSQAEVTLTLDAGADEEEGKP